ncbi:hypothetical protein, partial [Hafnia paralvei]|uniref:hypothetical protein n=2 Tax=Hafnia paralvei TaxID=546367 RepID=UPI0038D10A44
RYCSLTIWNKLKFESLSRCENDFGQTLTQRALSSLSIFCNLECCLEPVRNRVHQETPSGCEVK